MNKYIHQLNNWPHFTWENDELLYTLGNVRNVQGKLVGKLEALGFNDPRMGFTAGISNKENELPGFIRRNEVKK